MIERERACHSAVHSLLLAPCYLLLATCHLHLLLATCYLLLAANAGLLTCELLLLYLQALASPYRGAAAAKAGRVLSPARGIGLDRDIVLKQNAKWEPSMKGPLLVVRTLLPCWLLPGKKVSLCQLANLQQLAVCHQIEHDSNEPRFWNAAKELVTAMRVSTQATPSEQTSSSE